MTSIILYSLAIIFLILSFIKDKSKTKKAIVLGLKSFENIMPQFLGIIVLIGILLSVFNSDTISKIIGKESGFIGVILASLIGSITLIPGFVAFPTAAMLLKSGAGYIQIAAFISTLMMVGIVTFPVEIKYFGKKLTILRNLTAFVFSFIVALIIGKVMG